MKNKKRERSCKKAAVILAAFLMLLSAASLIYLMLPAEQGTVYAADIYQNGTLIMSIPLDGSEENRIFTIEGTDSCVNEIEVLDGSIGVISADCPDKLCVRQGFVSDSKLPVTCLPNRLVIRLRPLSGASDDDSPDAVAY